MSSLPLLQQFLIRTASTLAATLITVLIITERHRRVANAKVELAARQVELIEQEQPGNGHEHDIVRDLKLAEELVQDVTWSRLTRTAKIVEVAQVTREIRQIRREHEKLDQAGDAAERDGRVAAQIAAKTFSRLANEIRKLKVSLIDFIFVKAGKPAS